MFQVITAWNLISPGKSMKDAVENVSLRGYNPDTYLTGEFVAKIVNKEINPLSVSDIADVLCPTRRDLYFKKGKNRPLRRKKRTTWGSVAGRLVEAYITEVFQQYSGVRSSWTYSKIGKKLDALSENFVKTNEKDFNKLNKLKSRPDEKPDWLMKLLTFGGRAELGAILLHRILKGKDSNLMNAADLNVLSYPLKPDPREIGISRNVKPDFIVEKYKVIGDVKSSVLGFKEHFLLTCAGYALAYENQQKKKKDENKDINFGIIYFFPTRYSEHAKSVSFGQVYIFPIDDGLREYFLTIRNKAYEIISKDKPPDFPKPKDRGHCAYCQFYNICKSQGLKL